MPSNKQSVLLKSGKRSGQAGTKTEILEELRESEHLLRTIFENEPECVKVIDGEGKLLLMNPAGLAMIEADALEEVLGKSVYPLVTEAYRTRFQEFTREVYQGKKGTLEFEILGLKGTRRFLETYSVPLHTSNDESVAVLGITRDITIQRAAQLAMRESEIKFRTVAETAASAIFIYQGEKFKYINSAAAAIAGYSESEFLSMNFWDIVHPNYRELIKERGIARQRGEAVPNRYEFKIVAKSGEERWLDFAASQIIYQGTPAALGVAFDVTERKRAEEALRRSEERLRDLFTHASIGIYQSSLTGNWITVNNTLARMLGYASPEEMMQASKISDVYWDKGERKKLIEQYEPTGDVANIEVQWRKKDGTPLWVQLNAHAIKDSHSSTLYFEGFVLDISERKKIQEALERQRSFFQSLFENSPAAIVVLATDDVVLNANNAFQEMFGYSLQEIQGKSLNDFIIPDDKEEEALLLSKTSQGGRIVQKETFRRRKDGSLVPVNITGYPIIIEKEVIGVYGMYIDITERLQLEEHLRQAQKMESIGTLAGGIAHDFNNILAIIVGYASILEKYWGNKERFNQSVDAIRKATQRGATLVRQLLTFARKTSSTTESVNVNVIVEELSKMLASTFPKTISIEVNVSNGISFIIADPNQLHQALLNLCVNARDAMTDGGTLKIETFSIAGMELRRKFSDAQDKTFICISVSDSGTGIDQNTLKRIFEPFFTTKEHGKGTGLGLAVVYGIVESHRGFIDVESEPGKGTTFTIYLPTPETAPILPSTSETEEQEIQGGKETILIVEDEDVLRDLLTSTLQGLGYTVHSASDGLEAIEKYQILQKQIDLVISDIGLPKLDGWATSQRIKEINPDAKIILASGYIDPELQVRSQQFGTKDFVQKPYDPARIFKKIREVLDQKTPV
jgi:PAS domain S-box-containing protein